MNSDFPAGFAPPSCLVPDNVAALVAAWILSFGNAEDKSSCLHFRRFWGIWLQRGIGTSMQIISDIVEFPNDVQTRSTGVLPLPEPQSTKPASASWR